VYTNLCCDMIAMKREVAANFAGSPWSECQVNDTGDKSLCRNTTACVVGIKPGDLCTKRRGNTRICVQSPLVVLVKVRKGGDFFYGKSGNENHSQGL